jgi:DNA-binding phage protein
MVMMSEIWKAAFVGDEVSMILALQDALACMDGPAISNAFLQVARARGIERIAAEARISAIDIYRALADPAAPDLAILARVVEMLAQSLPPKEEQGDIGETD